ncbi:hypothetical protein ACHAWF_014112 [Thalassiosira exigua]
MASSTTDPSVGGLTTATFEVALARHVDASKPDRLARGQMEGLRLSWECSEQTRATGGKGEGEGASLSGTLTLSSDVVSVAVHVRWKCTISQHRGDATCSVGDDGGRSSRTNNTTINRAEDAEGCTPDTRFGSEFHICLLATARAVPLGDRRKSDEDDGADRKERSTRRKLHAGMLKRLRSDPTVRRLLVEEGVQEKGAGNTCSARTEKADRGLPLCEALVQENRGIPGDGTGHGTDGRSETEREERVNVHSDTLGGIRTALFGHVEDDLDVLELLLNLPYFPRRGWERQTPIADLAERAYLRLLEDAMFDACEREGEDEMLDDLVISDAGGDPRAAFGEDAVGKNCRTTKVRRKR